MKMEHTYYEKGIETLIRLNIYKDKGSIMRDAFRALLELKPSLKIEYAVDLYKQGDVSLWSGAKKAGLTLEELR